MLSVHCLWVTFRMFVPLYCDAKGGILILRILPKGNEALLAVAFGSVAKAMHYWQLRLGRTQRQCTSGYCVWVDPKAMHYGYCVWVGWDPNAMSIWLLHWVDPNVMHYGYCLLGRRGPKRNVQLAVTLGRPKRNAFFGSGELGLAFASTQTQ